MKKKSAKQTDKKVPEEQTTFDAATEVPTEPIQEYEVPASYQDYFELDSDGAFPQALITEIVLPKLIIANDSELRIANHQPLVLQAFNNKPMSGNIIKALKNGLAKFEVKIFETEQNFSVWNFLSPKIIAVDFGNITSQPRTDYRTVQCEIDFSGLEIDGVTIRTK